MGGPMTVLYQFRSSPLRGAFIYSNFSKEMLNDSLLPRALLEESKERVNEFSISLETAKRVHPDSNEADERAGTPMRQGWYWRID